MIDRRYREVQDLLEEHVHQDVRNFHAKTNCLLSSAVEGPLDASRQKLAQSLAYDDLPLSPFESGRIFGAPAYNMGPKRAPSAKAFHEGPVTFEALFALLAEAFGDRDSAPRRAYPSRHALYPVQVIVGIRAEKIRGESLKTGFYHFRPTLNALDFLAPSTDEGMLALILGDEQTEEKKGLSNFSFFLLYAAFMAKALFEEGARGYRFALMEAGAMVQQACLLARPLGLAEKVWFSFEELHACKAAGLHPATYFPLVAHLWGGRVDV